MSRIGETIWDDEAFPDRVDLIRLDRRKDASRPPEISLGAAIPCSIQYGGAFAAVIKDPTEVASVASDRTAVAFAEDVALQREDLIAPISPSVGSRIRVSSFRYVAEMQLFVALGVQVS